ncbi:MAG TPA: adenylyl-sulfate kinase, partial [Terriglobia bacterium]|nr:adenylyl-sulfate kinase [Terriglobia bacterium]
IAKMLEKRLFDEGYMSYYLGISNLDHGLDSDVLDTFERREERIRRLGELARILTDSGQIFVTSISDLDAHDRTLLKALNEPNEILFVNVGQESSAGQGDVVIVSQSEAVLTAVDRIGLILKGKEIIPDYSI